MTVAAEALRDAAAWLDREDLLGREIKKLSAAARRLFWRQEKLFDSELAKRTAGRLVSESAADERDLEFALDAALEATELDLVKPTVATSTRALGAGGDQLFDQLELAATFTFDRSTPEVEDYIAREAARLVTQVSDSTRRRMRATIRSHIEQDYGIGAIAKAIRERFRGMRTRKPQGHIRDRAQLIAVTELGEAFEVGAAMGSKHLERGGIRLEKAWTDTGDERVSPGCRTNSAAGWIPNKQAFPSGHQHPLRFPGCRCSSRRRLAAENR